ncbi:MAG: PKD-like domain-containing protein [Cyclobacteriaceae bacterium]|nr:PKD-like domain-containing protein [Cyclobacteriaceae bacterium]
MAGALFPDGTRLEDVLINNTNAPQTITYEFEVRANGCINAATITEMVTVNPTPEMTVTNNAPTLCPGSSTDIQVSSVTANAEIELIGVTISPDAGGVSNYTVVGTKMDFRVRIPRDNS